MTMTTTANLCQILGGVEERIIQYNEIALEDLSCIATRQKKQSEREIMETFIECRRQTGTIESAQ